MFISLLRHPASMAIVSVFSLILFSGAGHALESLNEPMAGTGAVVQIRGGEHDVGVLQPGVKLFSDRPYTLLNVPGWLAGKSFLRSSIEGIQFDVVEDGVLTILVPERNHPATTFQGEVLERSGYKQVRNPESFQLFGPNTFEKVNVYQKQVQSGDSINLHKFGILVGLRGVQPWTAPDWRKNDGERLENGIVLPRLWPPRHLDPASIEPMPVPYLEHPPAVITIDRGRQLFVDDFLIEKSDLSRVYHHPEKYSGNPVFRPESKEELASSSVGEPGQDAVCYLGHGGVFFDPGEGLFRMYYTAGWRGGLALAVSRDLVHWERPDWKSTGTNILIPKGWDRVGGDNSLWFDINAKDPAQRIKFMTDRGKNGHRLLTSPDGVEWSREVETGRAGDYCSFFYNPFRDVWCYSIKSDGPRGRSRKYSENTEFMQGADWSRAVYWTNADKLDLAEPEGGYPGAGELPQLYSLNAVAYESVMVGMHYIHRGPNNGICDQGQFPKLTDLELGFSRDGFHWDRPDRSGFLRGERSPGTWDRAYLHGTTGVFVVLNDRLVFPYTGYSGVAPNGKQGMYTGASIGIATLRRDGFASLNAGESAGVVTTRPLTFQGSRLFVNVKNPQGSFRVAVLDESGKEIAPFTRENCLPISQDSTLEAVRWKGGEDLSALRGRPVRFQFELTNGELYSFWVSRDESGRSDGYVAAGGPGYPGTVDTVGRTALEAK